MKDKIICESITSLRQEGLRFSVDILAEKLIVFGPYLAGVVSLDITDSVWYKIIIKIFECFAGVMIEREIIFKKSPSRANKL